MSKSYCFSNCPSEFRFKTAKPACLAMETDACGESFGSAMDCTGRRSTDWPQVGQDVISALAAVEWYSKPSPQSRHGGWAGA